MGYNPYTAVKNLRPRAYRCVDCGKEWEEVHFGATIPSEHQRCSEHDGIGFAMRQCRVEFYRMGPAPDPDSTARALKAVREAVRFRRQTVKSAGRPELRRAVTRVAMAEGHAATESALRDLIAVAEEWATQLEISPGRAAVIERGLDLTPKESRAA